MASIRVREGKSGIRYYVLWRDADTSKQTSMPFADHQQAQNFRRMLEANSHHLAPAAEMLQAIDKRSPTVTSIVEKHIAGLATITARSRADYRRDAARHITPYMGHVPIATVTPERLGFWLGELSDLEISDKTIANVHGLLSSAIATAVAAGHRPDNPCKGMRLPRRSEHESDEMVFLTPDDWRILDVELDDWRTVDKVRTQGPYAHYRLVFRTLINTGMRWGEVAALRPSELALKGSTPTISILRAVKRDEHYQFYIGPTKTKRSRRKISIPQDLADELAKHAAGRDRDGLLFTSSTGMMMHSSNVRERAWLPALRRSQSTKTYGDNALTVTPRIHDLRHTHASWLIAAGVDLLTVQRRLGHESITTTADRYSHVLPGQNKAAADAVAAALGAVTSR